MFSQGGVLKASLGHVLANAFLQPRRLEPSSDVEVAVQST